MYLSSFQDFTTDKSTSVLVRSKNKGGGGNSPGSGSATDDEVLNLNICSKHDFKSTCSDPSPIEFVMRPSTLQVMMVGLLTDLFSNQVTFHPLSPKSDQHQISPCNINAL